MEKGEIACYKQFLQFPQCFQKAYFPGVSKGVIVWEWVNLGPVGHELYTLPLNNQEHPSQFWIERIDLSMKRAVQGQIIKST